MLCVEYQGCARNDYQNFVWKSEVNSLIDRPQAYMRLILKLTLKMYCVGIWAEIVWQRVVSNLWKWE